MYRVLFFTLLFIQSLFLFSQDEKRLALVIGNANYDSIAVLKNPVNDAKLIANTLDSLNFEVILATDLGKGEFMSKVVEFGKKRGDYDVGFVYYAGHGVQINGENYLLPTNQNFDEEWKIEEYAINVNRIMKYLTVITDQVNILILDACRNNPWEGNFRSIGKKNKGGLAKMPAPTGSLIAFSTDAGRVAADGEGENSTYTKSLVKNMLLENTTLDQVFRNVRAEVLLETQGNQRPVEFTQLTGQEFYLRKSTYSKEFEIVDSIISEGKDFLSGLSIIEPIIKENTDNKRALLLRAKIYNGLKDFSKAILDFKALISLDSIYSDAYFYRTTSFEGLNQYEKALADYSKAIELEPDNAKYYLFRGDFYNNQLEDYDKALADFSQAIELEPDNDNFFFNRALLYDKNIETYTEAIDDYYRVLEINPQMSSPLNNIALIYEELKDYNNALEAYNKIIELDPDEALYYSNRGGLYGFKLEDYDKALADFSQAIELEPDNAEYFSKRAILYTNNLKDYDNALADISKAIELNPDNEDFLSYRALLYQNNIENYTEAIAGWYGVLELNPKRQYINFNIAQIYRSVINDYDKALDSYTQEIKLYPNDPISYHMRAYLYEEHFEDYDKALADYSEAIQLAPDNEDYLIDRAMLYKDHLKEYDKALADYNSLIELDPENLINYRNRGMYKNELKRYDEALSDFNLAIKLNPKNKNSYVYFWRANFYLLNNKFKNALEDLDAAIEICLSEELNNYDNDLYEREHISEYYNSKALVYQKLKDYKNALINYNLAIKYLVDTKDISYYFNRSDLYIKMGDLDNAISDCKKTINLDPKDPEGYYNLSRVYSLQSNFMMSIIEISKSIFLLENQEDTDYYISSRDKKSGRLSMSDIYIERAILFSKTGNLDLMCVDYKKALNLSDNTKLNFYSPQKKHELDLLISESCN